jgi:hypothetical protein
MKPKKICLCSPHSVFRHDFIDKTAPIYFSQYAIVDQLVGSHFLDSREASRWPAPIDRRQVAPLFTGTDRLRRSHLCNFRGAPSVEDHASDRFTRVHEIKGFIDFLQRHRVGDEIVDVDFLFHVPVDDLRNIGAAPRAAEGRAFPYPSGDELEWTRFDLLASAGYTNNHRDAPAAVAAFQCLAHHINITDALESIVGATVCYID